MERVITLKDGVIEIQGEQRDLLVSELTKRGFTVKKVRADLAKL